VPRDILGDVTAALAADGVEAWVVGRVEPGEGVALA
jgi:hypothetical protein